MATKQEYGSFDEMLASSELPILVDFYADWCGPCQIMAKVLVEFNEKMKDRVKVVKIDTEKYPELASQHHVHALPTLVLFKQGKSVERIEGVLAADQLIERLGTVV